MTSKNFVFRLSSFFLCFAIIHLSQANNPGFHPGNGRNMQPKPQKGAQVFCTQDSLMIYSDCRMCVCPKPMKPARCMKKQCDLRTKQSGQCPQAVLKMDDSKLCPHTPTPGCKSDNDCQGQQLCCFNFCSGSQCVNPVPLDHGMPIHGGMGYQ